MPYDLTEPLVIGISSRALFNLEEENRIYENEGLAAYEEYQVKHESDILQKGSQIAITSWTPRGKNLAHGWSRRIYP